MLRSASRRDGPASLLAAAGVSVRNAQGQPLTPFDLVWKTLLPQWGTLTALGVDGKQGPLNLRTDDPFDMARLWLLTSGNGEGVGIPGDLPEAPRLVVPAHVEIPGLGTARLARASPSPWTAAACCGSDSSGPGRAASCGWPGAR